MLEQKLKCELCKFSDRQEDMVSVHKECLDDKDKLDDKLKELNYQLQLQYDKQKNLQK